MSFYTIGNILPQAVGFLLLPIYSRYLTPADYGVVSSMQVLISIFGILFTLAIDKSVYRLYFDYKLEKDKKDFLGTITISLIIISIFSLSLLFVLKDVIGLIFKSIEFSPFYIYAILTALANVFILIPKIYLQINEKADKYFYLSTLQFLLTTGFVLWFVLGEKSGASGMLKGQLFGNLILLPFIFYIIYHIINFTYNFKMLKEILLYSLPVIPALLSSWILNLSDRVFIERYFDLNDVGIYSIGYKIAGLVLVVSGAFYQAYNPIFYKLAGSTNQEKAKKQLSKYNDIYIVALLLVVFFITLFSKEAIQLLLDKKYLDAYKIVPLIALSYLFYQAGGLLNFMMYQEKKTVQVMYMVICSAALNIFLNFLLVPKYGAYGAAIATILTFMALFIANYWYAMKCYFIPFNWPRITKIFLILFTIIILFQLVNINIFLTLLIKAITCVAIGIVFLTKYYKQLRSVINTR